MRYRHYYETALGVEYLELKIISWDVEDWAIFTASVPPALEGDYAALSSTDTTWDQRLESAVFSFTADSTFLLTNPVTLEPGHAETNLVITESGSFSVGTDSIRFSVFDQQPAGHPRFH